MLKNSVPFWNIQLYIQNYWHFLLEKSGGLQVSICVCAENYRNGTLISLTMTHLHLRNLYFLRMKVRHMSLNVYGFLTVIKYKSSLCRDNLVRFYVHKAQFKVYIPWERLCHNDKYMSTLCEPGKEFRIKAS